MSLYPERSVHLQVVSAWLGDAALDEPPPSGQSVRSSTSIAPSTQFSEPLPPDLLTQGLSSSSGAHSEHQALPEAAQHGGSASAALGDFADAKQGLQPAQAMQPASQAAGTHVRAESPISEGTSQLFKSGMQGKHPAENALWVHNTSDSGTFAPALVLEGAAVLLTALSLLSTLCRRAEHPCSLPVNRFPHGLQTSQEGS